MRILGQESHEILAIIPARGGSKRITNKNIVDFKGKPLIAWTIESALKSSSITRTIVTTENEEIAKISKEFGAEVPFLRKNELSEDSIHAFYPILDTLDYLKDRENYIPNIVVMLLPTSPLRRTIDIEACLMAFQALDVDAVISVTEVSTTHSIRTINKDNWLLETISKIDDFNTQSQESEKLYSVNGSIFISTPARLRKYGTFHCPNSFGYVMRKENSVDINTIEDLELAERLFNE